MKNLRISAIIISLFICISMTSILTVNAKDFTLTITGGETAIGGNIPVQIQLSDGLGIYGGELRFEYDPDALQLISALNGGIISNGLNVLNTETPGFINSVFVMMDGTDDAGVILDLVFLAKQQGTALINVTKVEFINSDMEKCEYVLNIQPIEISKNETETSIEISPDMPTQPPITSAPSIPVISTTPVPQTEAPSEHITSDSIQNSKKLGSGDINLDEKLNLVDLLVLKRAINGKYSLSEEQHNNADLNGDGIIDEKDLAMLKNEILRKGTLN